MKPTTKTSRVRFAVLAVTFLAAFLLYLHRFCMSYAQRYIREDLGISNDDLGFCFSAFFLTYALAQVPSGWMSDRWGARRMLTIYILVWSFFTTMMGFTAGFVSLLLVRLACGIGQAGAYPTAASLIAKWIPTSSRGKASAFVAWGGRLGSGLAPILTTTLIVFFVPVDTPTNITSDSILNLDQLADQLVESNEEHEPSDLKSSDVQSRIPANSRGVRYLLVSRLDPATQTLLQKHASQELSKISRSSELVWRSNLNKLTEAERASIRENIITVLNNWVEHQPLTWHQLSDVQFEREVSSLSQQSELTATERRRCKRLILETVLPDSLSKIYVVGWRQVMFTYGSFGVIVAFAFWVVFRDSPRQHPKCNSSEVALIESGRKPTAVVAGPPGDHDSKLDPPPMRAMLRSRSLWMMCITQWGRTSGGSSWSHGCHAICTKCIQCRCSIEA